MIQTANQHSHEPIRLSAGINRIPGFGPLESAISRRQIIRATIRAGLGARAFMRLAYHQSPQDATVTTLIWHRRWNHTPHFRYPSVGPGGDYAFRS